jgi:acyl dehydratase
MNTFEVGQELAPQTFIINRALLKGYADASGDQNPIHQDEEFAKSVGLRKCNCSWNVHHGTCRTLCQRL